MFSLAIYRVVPWGTKFDIFFKKWKMQNFLKFSNFSQYVKFDAELISVGWQVQVQLLLQYYKNFHIIVSSI